MEYEYTDNRTGIVDTVNDRMYVMDDYGYLVEVDFCLFNGYFQEDELTS